MNGMFRNRWWVVFASVLGLLVGAGSINVFAFGVFLKPVSEDLGLSRGILSSALALNGILTAVSCPLIGLMIDRWGVRTVMLPCIALFALATAGYSLLQPEPLLIVFAIYGFAGLVGGGQTPIAYAKTVSGWFDKERGLALGVAMAGVGLGAFLIPRLAGFLIPTFGWRMAYVGMGVAVFVLGFLPVALFLRDPDRAQLARQPAVQRGLTAAEALKGSWRFWALTAAFFFGVLAINGTLTHVVALLTDRGIPVQDAIGALSAAGLAIIVGRILSGYCLDRFPGHYVAIIFFIIPMGGIGLLASGAGGSVPLLGAVLCGMGIGAEVDLMAFFVSRYFGLKAYGKIYGTMFGIFSVGTGLGPSLSGIFFDIWHSYTPIFLVYEGLLVITCLLFTRLGPYPFPPEPQVLAGDPKAAVA